MPKKTDREYRTMIQPLLIPTAAEKRIDTDFYVEGYATTFDKPYLLYEWDGNKYYERIDRNALAGADMSDVIMQYNHEGKVLARLSNGTLGDPLLDRAVVLYAKAEFGFNDDAERYRNAYDYLKCALSLTDDYTEESEGK